MKCPICGAEVGFGEKFCAECGNEIRAEQSGFGSNMQGQGMYNNTNMYGNARYGQSPNMPPPQGAPYGYGQQQSYGQPGFGQPMGYNPNVGVNYGYAAPVFQKKRTSAGKIILIIVAVVVIGFLFILGVGLYHTKTKTFDMNGFSIDLPMSMKENDGSSNIGLNSDIDAEIKSYTDSVREFVYIKYDFSNEDYAPLKYVADDELTKMIAEELEVSLDSFKTSKTQNGKISFTFENLSEQKMYGQMKCVKNDKSFYLTMFMCEEDSKDIYAEGMEKSLDSITVK